MKKQQNKYKLSRETKLYIYSYINVELEHSYKNMNLRGHKIKIPNFYPHTKASLEVQYSNDLVNTELSNWIERQYDGWYDDVPDYFELEIGPFIGIIPTDQILNDEKFISIFHFEICRYDEKKDNWKAWFI